ncbi:MAG TPA: hypothetical protein VMT20_08315 [Terriglobia bacterium]|nr:hypothetical protein [Terriglobia bacterium]
MSEQHEGPINECLDSTGSPDLADDRLHVIIKPGAASPLTEHLIRDARVSHGQRGRPLLSKHAEFQNEYATLSLSGKASLDEDHMWLAVFVLKELTSAEQAGISALVQKAVSRIAP